VTGTIAGLIGRRWSIPEWTPGCSFFGFLVDSWVHDRAMARGCTPRGEACPRPDMPAWTLRCDIDIGFGATLPVASDESTSSFDPHVVMTPGGDAAERRARHQDVETKNVLIEALGCGDIGHAHVGDNTFDLHHSSVISASTSCASSVRDSCHPR
jgi:hypothetical protein